MSFGCRWKRQFKWKYIIETKLYTRNKTNEKNARTTCRSVYLMRMISLHWNHNKPPRRVCVTQIRIKIFHFVFFFFLLLNQTFLVVVSKPLRCRGKAINRIYEQNCFCFFFSSYFSFIWIIFVRFALRARGPEPQAYRLIFHFLIVCVFSCISFTTMLGETCAVIVFCFFEITLS